MTTRTEAVKAYLLDLQDRICAALELSLIHISEPTRQAEISYAVFCFQRGTNAVLQVEQVGFNGFGAGSHGITLNRAKLRGARSERRPTQMGA